MNDNRRIRSHPCRSASAAAFIVLCCASNSQQSATQQMAMTQPDKKQIVMENIYNYEIRQYRAPTTLDVATIPSESGYTSPESTVRSYISAMMAKDWQWFLQGWTHESANEIEQENKNKGISVPTITSRWNNFVGKRIELVSRIDTGQYAVVVYQLVASDGTVSKSFAPMKHENGKWLLTNDLRDDPLLTAGLNLNWTSEGRAVVT